MSTQLHTRADFRHVPIAQGERCRSVDKLSGRRCMGRRGHAPRHWADAPDRRHSVAYLSESDRQRLGYYTTEFWDEP